MRGKPLSRSVPSILLVLCFALFVSVSLAEAKAEYSWKFAQPWTRPLQNKGYELFCEKVKEYSNGRIEIKFFPDGLLGTHDESFHAVQMGSEALGVFAPYVNLVPGGMLNWMPWTIENWEECKVAFMPPDGILYKVMQKAWNEVGMHQLFVVSQGAYGLANNARPLRSPDDLKNLKMRVSASLASVKMLGNMGKGTGMTMETIPWAELYNALSRGVVDGCWSMWPSLVEERHYEVLKHYSDVNFLWDVNNVVINKTIWDKLPDDLKDAVNKAARDAEAFLYDMQEKAEAEYIKKLSEVGGFEITKLTPEEREVFRARSNMPEIWDELCKPWLDKHYPGENMTEKVQEELLKIHKEILAKQNP